ncbi:DUF2514 family protein [Giesbergeria anulus]|uniref:Bacteriophage Rz lysis protein n=1 Tax=Giesbergeria anulus TaxID=180197 RepID=A0A1H9E2Y4_9BURK|nr:DUF2514 family protein [Giesbergeria anulus]SEQ19952.1 Protein of unknown function [Giesbergeria anulus]
MTPVWPLVSLALALLLWLQTAQLHQAQDQVATLELQQELGWAQKKNLETQYRHDSEQQDAQTRAALQVAHTDADRARDVAVGLRRDLAHFIDAHRTRVTAATEQCAPDDSAIVVLSDLFSRADDAAGELAAAFDEARARGLGCEGTHDAAVTASRGQ